MTVLHVMASPLSLCFLRGQGDYMKKHEFELVVVCSPGGDAVLFAREEGVDVHQVSITRSFSPLKDLVSLIRLVRLIRRLRPIIVQAHTPKAGLLGMVAARLAGVRGRIYSMRGLPSLTARGGVRLMLECAERVSCTLARRVICESESLRAVVLARGLCNPAKCTVLANGSGHGVDAAVRFNPQRFRPEDADRIKKRFNLPPSGPIIGFVGRLTLDKGLRELWRAWQVVKESHRDAVLFVVGDLDSRLPLPEGLLGELSSDARVRRTAWTSEIAEAYSVMDLLVLPSYREGLPNVVLEASAMEIPVVATDVVGCVDAIRPGVTGSLVPVRDPSALAAAIVRYLESPELRKRHGTNAREWVAASFQPQTIMNELVLEYRRVSRTNSGSTQ